MDTVDRTPLLRGLPDNPHTDRYGDPLPEGAVGRIGTLRFRHSIIRGNGRISSVCFSSDGSLLAVAAKEDSRISVWEIPSGRLRHMLEAKDHYDVLSAQFSPNGRLLVSEGFGGVTTALWDITTGERLHWFPANAGRSPIFSPNGELLVTTDHEAISLWDVTSQRLLKRLRPTADQLTFSANGLLLAGRRYPGIRIWRMPSGEPWEDVTHPDTKYPLYSWGAGPVFSPDGRWMAAVLTNRSGWTGRLVLWSLDKKFRIAAANFPIQDSVERLSFSPDGNLLLTWGTGGPSILRAWHVPSGQKQWEISLDYHNEMAVSSGSPILASIKHGVFLHDLRTGDLVGEIPSHSKSPEKLAFSPTEPSLLAIAHWEGLIELRATNTGQEVPALFRHATEVRDLCFSSDGTKLATLSNSEAILWEADTGRRLVQFPVPFARAKFASTNDRFVIFGLTSQDTIPVWEWATGKPWSVLAESSRVWAVIWSGQDRIAVGCREWAKARLYSTVSGQVVGELPGPFALVAQNGKVFAVPDQSDRLQLWQINPLRELGEIELPRQSSTGAPIYLGSGDNSLSAFAFSPDGAMLGCRSRHENDYQQQGVLVWDVATGRLISEAYFRVRDESTLGDAEPALGFRADGSPLLAVPTYRNQDGEEWFSITIWDGKTGIRLHERSHEHGYFQALSFAPNGKTLAVTWDTSVMLWGL